MVNLPHLRGGNAFDRVPLKSPVLKTLQLIGDGAVIYWDGNGNSEAVLRPFGVADQHTVVPGRHAKALVDQLMLTPPDDPFDGMDDGLPYYITPRGLAFLRWATTQQR